MGGKQRGQKERWIVKEEGRGGWETAEKGRGEEEKRRGQEDGSSKNHGNHFFTNFQLWGLLSHP